MIQTISTNLDQKVLSYWENLGYTAKEREGLIDSAFPTTFNPSAGHSTLANMRDGDVEGFKTMKYVVPALCIREFDSDTAPFKRRLTLFRMTVAFASELMMENAIDQYIGLMKELGLDLQKTVWTVWGGGRLGTSLWSKEPLDDSASYEHLKKLGITRIYQSHTSYNYLFPAKEKEFSGPRVEIYYQLPNKELLEIGTIEKVDHLVAVDERDARQLIPLGEKSPINQFIGIASGLERLEMAMKGYNEMWEIDVFAPYFLIFDEYLSELEQLLFRKDLLVLIDRFRAVVFMMYDGALSLPSQDSRRRSTKRYMNTIILHLEEMNLLKTDIMKRLFYTVVHTEGAAYPDLSSTEAVYTELYRKCIEDAAQKRPGSWF